MPRYGLWRAFACGTWPVLLLMAAPGCNAEAMPKTYQVKGKVVYKNGKPYPGGQITFSSVADPELRGYGKIAGDGTFTLATIAHTSRGRSQTLQGVVEGEFRVNILPGGRNGNAESGPVGGPAGSGRPFTLRKTYRIEAKDNSEITVVVE
jgi:hypothetical protein